MQNNMKNKLLPILILNILLVLNFCGAQSIAAGGRHSLKICSDGTVESWGYNGFGQLGNGNIAEQHTGTQVIGLNNITQVAGGLFHSLFIKQDGSAWACGRNPMGNLGDGTNVDRDVPVQVMGLKDIILAAGGGEHSIFLDINNRVWTCGNNASGQLGDGTNINKNKASLISSLHDVIDIAAGAEYSLFLKKDGSVWACGNNSYGQYGNGTNTSNRSPVIIPTLSDIVDISAGEWHSLFVKRDGTVYSSGRNHFGQLGDGSIIDKNIPTKILGLDNIKQAEAGGIHSVFLRSDGSVFACGLNSGGNNDGQLGDGTLIDRHNPTAVIISWQSGKIIQVEATREHTLYLHDNGMVWGSGRNNYGQLGYGSFSTKNSIVPILSKAVCSALNADIKYTSKNEQNILYDFQNKVIQFYNCGEFYKLDILNHLGEKIYTVENINNHALEINLTSLSNGIYIFRFLSKKNKIISKKILIY